MARRIKTEHNRQQIIEAVSELLYHKGFNPMSFSDIAEAAGVPRGNLNYYFRTKEDVLAAVIEHRLGKMRIMLTRWDDEFATPAQRLQRYARIPLTELRDVVRFGCPMGSLNIELAKSQPELQTLARAQFDMFRAWLTKQFCQLATPRKAEQLSLQLLARTQGIAVVAQAFSDPAFVKREVKELEKWISDLVDE